MVVNLKLLILSRHWDPLFVSSVVLSVLAFFGVTLAYHAVRLQPGFANWLLDADFPDDFGPIPASFETFWVAFHALSSWGIWLVSLLILVVCLVPDMAVQALRKTAKSMEDAGVPVVAKLRRSFRSRLPPPPPVQLGMTLTTSESAA